MRKFAKRVVPLLTLMMVAGAIAALYQPAPGTNSPYMSALSEITLGTAARACPGKRCNLTNNTCVQGHKTTQCVFSMGTFCTGTVTC